MSFIFSSKRISYNMSMKHICPVCHKSVKTSTQDQFEETQFLPFCSRRCKLVDLGAWMDARYKIISNPRLQGPAGPSGGATGGLSDEK